MMDKEPLVIVQAGHPVLRAPATPVAPSEIGTPSLSTLIEQMVVTMRNAPGVGLAAPQVGVSKRILVMEDQAENMARLSADELRARGRVPLDLTVLINPEIVSKSGPPVTFLEGCLSVRGFMALVTRSSQITLRGLTAKGKPTELHLSGWPARIAQHEMDHLDGTLYVDRMITRSLCDNAEVRERWLNQSTERIIEALDAHRPVDGPRRPLDP